MAARQISWSLAVAPGVARNPTARTKEYQTYLGWMSRYWNIDFPFQPNPAAARINIVFARVAVMQADIARRIIYVSDRHIFGSSYQQCRLLCHEFLHLAGGANHLPQPHIMSVNAGTAGNFTMADCGYMRAYGWRGAARPWLEPNAMATRFAAMKSIEETEDDSPLAVYSGVLELLEHSHSDACGCKDNRKHTWRSRLFGHPTP